jgi:hypothetical protein
MLEYTLGPAAKKADWSWSEAGDWALSAHNQKLTQLKVDLEGMMYSVEPGSFVDQRLQRLLADISKELHD